MAVHNCPYYLYSSSLERANFRETVEKEGSGLTSSRKQHHDEAWCVDERMNEVGLMLSVGVEYMYCLCLSGAHAVLVLDNQRCTFRYR